MSDIDDEIIEPVEPAGMMLFVRRRRIKGRYPIADLLKYTRIGDHGAFLKLRISDEQSTLLEDRETKFLRMDLLKADNPESDFLGEEDNADTKDVRGYGMTIEKYIQIVPVEVQV